MKKVMDDELRHKITSLAKKLGFIYVTLDLEGYRTGSMNERLPFKSGGNLIPVGG